MPSMTLVFSGPQGKLAQARKALKGEHFDLVLDANGEPSLHNWGHAESHETEWSGARYSQSDIDELNDATPNHGKCVGDIVHGTGEIVPKKAQHPVTFVSAEGDDLDRAVAALEPLGYRLRGHWNNEADIQVSTQFGGLGNFGDLTSEQRLARVEQDLAILKGGK